MFNYEGKRINTSVRDTMHFCGKTQDEKHNFCLFTGKLHRAALSLLVS